MTPQEILKLAEDLGIGYYYIVNGIPFKGGAAVSLNSIIRKILAKLPSIKDKLEARLEYLDNQEEKLRNLLPQEIP